MEAWTAKDEVDFVSNEVFLYIVATHFKLIDRAICFCF